jgi:small subunit ribosomal protein S8
MITDAIGDFLTRIKNAQERKYESVQMPANKVLLAICEILKSEGFIKDFALNKVDNTSNISVEIKYVNGVPVIREAKRVSKPGIRKYRGYTEIRPIKNGLGISIFSTSKGMLTGENAKKLKIGGEYICDIY